MATLGVISYTYSRKTCRSGQNMYRELLSERNKNENLRGKTSQKWSEIRLEDLPPSGLVNPLVSTAQIIFNCRVPHRTSTRGCARGLLSILATRHASCILDYFTAGLHNVLNNTSGTKNVSTRS